MKLFSRAVLSVVWCAAIAGGSHAAQSQNLPTRPVRLLVPSPPGGPSDFAGRLIAPGLSEALGQNVVVDARQSVNGILSMETAARAAPDGSTLAIGNSGTHVMNVGLYRKLPYDPIRDFVPVSQLISAGTALVANPKIGPNSFKEFIAAAKKDPGKFNIAIAGANGQVATEVLKVLDRHQPQQRAVQGQRAVGDRGDVRRSGCGAAVDPDHHSSTSKPAG